MRWIRRYKHQLAGVETAENRFGSVQWVLSRSLYRFTRFDLAAVSVAQRVSALRLQIGQWVPFARVGCYVIWEGASAQVWAWDAEDVESEIRRVGLKPKSVTVIPETLLNEKRVSLSFLQQSLDGFEGQYWHNGSLVASRWWPQMPSLGEWINFQRDAGLSPEMQSAEIPKPVPLRWKDQPWKKSIGLDAQAGGIVGVYQVLMVISMLGLVCASAWIGSQFYQYRLSSQIQRTNLRELTKQNMPFVEARATSLAAQSRIKELQALYKQPDVLGLLAKVAETLPKDGTYLRDWEFRDNKLKYQLVSPKKLLLSDYLKQLELLGLFKDIQASQGNDPTLTLVDMEIVAEAEIKFDSLGVASGSTVLRPETRVADDLTKALLKK